MEFTLRSLVRYFSITMATINSVNAIDKPFWELDGGALGVGTAMGEATGRCQVVGGLG